MSRLNLRDRVALASAAVLLVGLAALTFGVNLLLWHQLDADASTTLRERADALRANVYIRGGRVLLRDAPHDQALDQQAWLYAGGRALERPPASASIQRVADALANASTTTERTVGDVRLRAEIAHDEGGRRRVGTVVVGISLVPYRHTEHIALIGTAVLDLFVLAAGALLARRAVGNALRPVATMTELAADWSEHDLDRRFNQGPPRDELTALSAMLDRLLGRIASSLRHEQRFSAEMAHELRTPLSGVRGEAELALSRGDPSQEVRESLEQILRGTARMEAVIETLLIAARSNARVVPACARAGRVAAIAAEAIRPVADHAAVRLAVVGPPSELEVGADEDLVAQALNPLLDNAVRHARSAVTLTVTREHGHVLFSVRDDGEGVAAPGLRSIFEPGHTTGGGAGLGLPLARRLARSCGGEVTAMHSSAGGHFELRVPALA